MKIRLVCYLDGNGDEVWRVQTRQWFLWLDLIDLTPLNVRLSRHGAVPPREFRTYEEALGVACKYQESRRREYRKKHKIVYVKLDNDPAN